MTESDVRPPDRGPAVQLRAIGFFEGPDDAALARAVRAAGGEVLQVTQGLVVAVFAAATAAIEVARSLGSGARAGLSGGDVLFEDGLAHGTPVIEASRLKDIAAPGQALCARRLARLARLPGAALRDVGELELKGLPAPLPACEIVPG